MTLLTNASAAYGAALESHAAAITHPRAAETDPAVLAGIATDDAARELCLTCPNFAAAFGANLRGYVVAPLTPDGSTVLPGAEPTVRLADLLDSWAQWPEAPAGVLLDPSGLIAASVDSDGWEWLRSAAAVAAAPAGPVRPAEGDDYRPAYLLDHGGAALMLVEDRNPVGPLRTLAFFGSAGMKAAAEAFGPSAGPRVRDGLLWEASPAWELPAGRRARGIRLLDVVPADNAVIEVDGRRWRARWPLRPGALPDWLAGDVLGGKPKAAAA